MLCSLALPPSQPCSFPPECFATTTKKACSNLAECTGKNTKDLPYCKNKTEKNKKKGCSLRKGHLPAEENDLSIYWRLARPELLRKWKASEKGKDNPVSSDAFSLFSGGGTHTQEASDANDHNNNVTAITKYMLNTCVRIADGHRRADKFTEHSLHRTYRSFRCPEPQSPSPSPACP